ncbi:MAG: hypothetical protein LBD23_04050, partial [Oscillospiraceae bacterium]|nr:hypothetical protein [Oscillospiraceae bacterium]
MINELKLIDNIDILFKNKLVLYGVGQECETTLRLLKFAGISALCFCDEDCEKLKEIDKNEDVVIIVADDNIGIKHNRSVNENSTAKNFDKIANMQLKTEYVFSAYG